MTPLRHFKIKLSLILGLLIFRRTKYPKLKAIKSKWSIFGGDLELELEDKEG